MTSGAPELTELGKRIEMLRIQRGISKQHLARFAGTSRQQLWRVMTGKSEMSPGLRARIADALQAPNIQLPASMQAGDATRGGAVPPAAQSTAMRASRRTPMVAAPLENAPSGTRIPVRIDFERYLADADAIARTLATMPTGTRGRALKRRFLDAVEDAALEARSTLGAAFFDLRRRVLAGEL